MEQRSTSLRGADKAKILVRDISESLGKLPPSAPDLEEAVLGALMLERDALINLLEFLRPEHFYVESHRLIYEAVLDLFKVGEPVDMRTVVAQLRKNGKIDLVDGNGAYKVAELTSRVNSAANIEYHAKIIVEYAIKRNIIEIASQMHHDAYEDTSDVFVLLDNLERGIFEISDKNLRKKQSSIKQLIYSAVVDLQNKRDHKDGLTGVPTGFSAVDRVTSGWQKSDLIIIAARPGMGKTAFVVSAARNASVDFGIPVGVFSMEMSDLQLTNRLLSAEVEIDGDKFRRGQFGEPEWQALIHKSNRLTEAPLFIDDTPALTILELRAKCRRMKAEHNVQLIIVDYLQLMRGDSKGNREQEISSISRSLKGIAKELNIPVIALSQLSRGVETRGGDKRPHLSDLRDSGAIEQDADVVIFLYRPEYYKITVDEDGMPTQGMAEIIIAKHRNGSLENVKLKFISRYTKFIDWSGSDGENPYSGMTGGPTFKGTDQSKYKQYHSKDPTGEEKYHEQDIKKLPSEGNFDDETPF